MTVTGRVGQVPQSPRARRSERDDRQAMQVRDARVVDGEGGRAMEIGDTRVVGGEGGQVRLGRDQDGMLETCPYTEMTAGLQAIVVTCGTCLVPHATSHHVGAGFQQPRASTSGPNLPAFTSDPVTSPDLRHLTALPFARQYMPGAQRLVSLLFALACLLALATPLQAHSLTSNELAGVAFEPHPGAKIPTDLTFKDELGQTVRLGDELGRRPVVLTLNYFTCPNLCPLTVQDLASALGDVPFALGDQYTVLTVSIDPTDTPVLAQQRKREYLRQYQHPGIDTGWHFLTGDQESITRLTDAVGFRYAFDPDQHEYAHPAGLVVLTPDGTVSRYLYGLDFEPNDLRLALVEASQQQIATPVDRVLLLCYHYDPEQGRYSSLILRVVQGGGAATLAGLGLFLGILWRRDLRGTPKVRLGDGQKGGLP
jgi:protein SCO1/2